MNRNTLYNVLKAVKYYPNGAIRDAIVTEEISIPTAYGVMTPIFKRDDPRQKFVKSISFYEDGTIKSIATQAQTKVKTSLGIISAEMITFHPNGTLYRLFPLNGQVNGFWSETDEAALTEKISFDLRVGNFSVKLISVVFYPEGTLKGMTFWPGESISLKTPLGSYHCRIGFNVYPNGDLKSFEPAQPITLKTSIGDIVAFDYDVIGIHADNNTVKFTKDGELYSLKTPITTLIATDSEGIRERIIPKKVINPLDGENVLLLATEVVFNDESLIINNKPYAFDKYSIMTHNMTVLSGLNTGNQSVVSLSM